MVVGIVIIILMLVEIVLIMLMLVTALTIYLQSTAWVLIKGTRLCATLSIVKIKIYILIHIYDIERVIY